MDNDRIEDIGSGAEAEAEAEAAVAEQDDVSQNVGGEEQGASGDAAGGGDDGIGSGGGEETTFGDPADGKGGEHGDGADAGTVTNPDDAKEPIRESIKDSQIPFDEIDGEISVEKDQRITVCVKGSPIVLDVIEAGLEYCVGVCQSDSHFIQTECGLKPGDRVKFQRNNVQPS